MDGLQDHLLQNQQSRQKQEVETLSHLPMSYYQTGWSKPSDVSSITFFTSSVW